MRSAIVFMAAASALATISATGAHAEDWCGYAARAKSIIECGYSTVVICQDAIGKGGMCFVDPEIAANATHFKAATMLKTVSGRS